IITEGTNRSLLQIPGGHETVASAAEDGGDWGTIHMGNLVKNPRVRLLYVVEDAEDRWPAIRAFWQLGDDTRLLRSKDLSTVLADARVQALVVATPTRSHEAIVTEALRARKAVFCEKPIAGDLEGTRRCYRLAREVGRPLLCAFNRRFDPSFSQVRREVREGKVGHVHMIKTTSRDSPMPSLEYLETSGGIFCDCAVHDIDMVLWVLGELPRRVATIARSNIPEIDGIGDWDTVAITLDFPSGSVGFIDLSRRSNYGYDQRLEVFGPRGMVSCGNEHPTPGVHITTPDHVATSAPIWYSYPSRFAQGYARELEHFLDAVQGKTKLSVTSRQTEAVVKIAAALTNAARTGQAVDLEWGPEEQLLEEE
ncbi:CG3609 protein, partial [Gryllus bimaculatus]